MPKLASYHDTLRLAALAVVAAAAVAAPSAALATRRGATGLDSTAVYWGCVFGGGSHAYCKKAEHLEDPPSVGVLGFSLTLRLRPFGLYLQSFGRVARWGFGPPAAIRRQVPPVSEPSRSAPCLAAASRPGRRSPGRPSPTPAWAGVLTVDYQLASPITTAGDVNDFLLVFDLVTPVWIDFAASTVTYETTGPGADFTKAAYSCTTVTGVGCGSDAPTSGITISYVPVPEPGAWAMLLLGFAGLRRLHAAGAPRMTARGLGVSRHQAAVHGNADAGDEGRRWQAQAERDVRNLFPGDHSGRARCGARRRSAGQPRESPQSCR